MVIDMYQEIFELVKYDNQKAILEVKEVSNLTIAEFPFISSKMDYITVTRGRNHVMTVINRDGSTWSVNWGENGCTMCSDSVNALKWAVVDFFQKDCGILLDLTVDNSQIKEATVYYNSNFRKWQLNLRVGPYQSQNIWFDDCKDENDAIIKAGKYIGCRSWSYRRAQTGIDTWVADMGYELCIE